MRHILALALACLALAAPSRAVAARVVPPRFTVTLAPSAGGKPITGRLIVILSTRAQPEPRLTASPTSAALVALDVDQLRPGASVVLDERAFAYPGPLASLPAGDYYAQAVINVYEPVHRADGHTIWVHMNDGHIETFGMAAGNVYGPVQPVHVGTSGDASSVKLTIDHVIAPQPKPADTEWLKHVSVQSEKLTKFWGRPVFVHATVLLPKGYAEHPDARYPVIYPLGHGIPFSFTTDSTGERVGVVSEVTGTESGYDFARAWRSDNFPRMIAITLEQQTPYFPDSYSVNSANNGPYGDAIVDEVMPYLETHFRAINQPWARVIEGASTSGWQTLAMQLQHPDFFGGAWIFQPDPIDFRRDQLIDIYSDTNAFTLPTGPFTTLERPFRRSTSGQVVWTERQLSRFEEALGTRGRSSYQLEGWEAVYGPTDADGYPKPLWDKRTGTIDKAVAAYWRDHGFDLRAYAERNWATLGPKLVGKLHFSAGDMDDFYLNLAVYQFQDFLKHTQSPHYEGEFTFGRPMKGHSWHGQTWADLVRRVGDYVKTNAPAGEATAGWWY